ncbi:hypothetical protein RMN56_16050 [Micromonospora halotolerans]|uniref:Lipoprotein n=1 Tax=Micromonospora halotolerans TaxID=709879 RepID=A0ABZ0A5U2_9ACTN|nr:hypothetical protein [Micromonospora halotolerans]WNM42758.1 hypothetical protein RMN56_16050 [Micromonospora halotolerans]
MRSTRLALLIPATVAVLVMAGCDDGDKPAASGGTGTPTTTPAAVPSATATAAPGMDAATKSACATIDKDIQTALKKVASAEKIGPPAGHSAVSAQYSAGAASLYANAFTTSTAVNDAVKDVATEMSELADTWATAPKKAPSKTALTKAVKQLETACSAT